MAFDTERLKEKNGKWPSKGRQIGEWQLIMAGNEADIWQYSSEGKWAGSYYRGSEDFGFMLVARMIGVQAVAD